MQQTNTAFNSENKKGVDLSRFYIRSGIRENCFCEKNPQYRMAPLPSSEARERAGLPVAWSGKKE